jgi:hypothetical protein
MKIAIRKNKYHQGTEWKDEDFYVYISDTCELILNHEHLIQYRGMEDIGCVLAGDAHNLYPELTNDDVPFGYPAFSNSFIVFKNSETGKRIYDAFCSEGDITKVLIKRKIMPCLYPANFIKIHPDPNEKPPIIWGE